MICFQLSNHLIPKYDQNISYFFPNSTEVQTSLDKFLAVRRSVYSSFSNYVKYKGHSRCIFCIFADISRLYKNIQYIYWIDSIEADLNFQNLFMVPSESFCLSFLMLLDRMELQRLNRLRRSKKI